MISDTLTARHNTHGDFHQNAVISQEVKELFRRCPGWSTMSMIQREALDVICLKLSRILSGNSNFADHWHDIAGYATLAENELAPKAEPTYIEPRPIREAKIAAAQEAMESAMTDLFAEETPQYAADHDNWRRLNNGQDAVVKRVN